ncbi:HNH endonuclease [Geodermatophilus sp. SYSU D00684]
MSDPRSHRRYRELRDNLGRSWRAQNRPCWHCQQPIEWDAPAGDPAAYELDHVVPVSARPDLTFDPTNGRPSHRRCNGSRGNRPPPLGLGKPSRRW